MFPTGKGSQERVSFQGQNLMHDYVFILLQSQGACTIYTGTSKTLNVKLYHRGNSSSSLSRKFRLIKLYVLRNVCLLRSSSSSKWCLHQIVYINILYKFYYAFEGTLIRKHIKAVKNVGNLHNSAPGPNQMPLEPQKYKKIHSYQ